ncbi:MAG: hypothetical protein M1491_04075 [Deltaproteobacteria bacterium]|nr:hypothetical protein [Deltaproteobacteria bacterium]
MSYRDVFEAVAVTVIPQDGGFPAGAADVDMMAILKDSVSAFGRRIILLRIFFHFIDVLPIVTFSRPRRFRHLDRVDREAFIRGLGESRWIANRMIFLVIKVVMMTLFYSSPEVEKQIGFKSGCAAEDE